jgi:hypothetical protein
VKRYATYGRSPRTDNAGAFKRKQQVKQSGNILK